jgi:TFIIF-interacting CTD phosphatase-like protein
MQDKIKLVLDIDHTMIVAVSQKHVHKMAKTPDFVVSFDEKAFGIFVRPFLVPFLRCCSHWFDLIVWTAGTQEYAESIIKGIFPHDIPKPPIYHREHCTRKWDSDWNPIYIKDLRKLEGFHDEKFLLLDDQKVSFSFTPANGMQLTPYKGSFDNTLFALLPHLWSIYKNGCVKALPQEEWVQNTHDVLEQRGQEFFKDCLVNLELEYHLWRCLNFPIRPKT